MDQKEYNFLNKFYSHLSQETDYIHPVLSVIYSELEPIGVQLKIDGLGRKYNWSIGLLEEHCDYITQKLQEITEPDIEVLYDVYSLDQLPLVDQNTFRSDIPDVTTVYKITDTSGIGFSLNLFSESRLNLNETIIVHLENGLRIISQKVRNEITISKQNEKYINDLIPFNYNPLPILVLSDTYHIVQMNTEAENYTQGISTGDIFWDLLIDQSTTVQEQLTTLDQDVSINLENIVLNPEKVARDDMEVLTGTLVIKRVRVQDKDRYIIVFHLLDTGRVIKLRESLQSSHLPILDQLNLFSSYYKESPDEAIGYGIDNYFPSSFAFTVNEETGPSILASSPEIDVDDIYEESIKLLAGMNTKQIIENGYITGTTPWNAPPGELRWIAFYLDNQKARGKVEIHTIGIVTAFNLLSIKPQMTNTFMGLQLSSVNQYKDAIMSDNADFITFEYNKDRHFSTISIIENILLELRRGCSELLAVYSSE